MPNFSLMSKNNLVKCRPELQEIANLAIQRIDFKVLDSLRGRAAQELAFRRGHSKAHFGQSAHNYKPAIAFDLFPAPYDWDNTESFIRLADVILDIAEQKSIPIRWGGDWNMDGKRTTRDSWDKPHYELHPWREWAKRSRLYQGV